MAPRIGDTVHIAPLLVAVLRRYGIELTEKELRAPSDRAARNPPQQLTLPIDAPLFALHTPQPR